MRLHACSQSNCSNWLHPPLGLSVAMSAPSEPNPSAFRACLRFRLGLPLFESSVCAPTCGLCRVDAVDALGDHALLCLGGGAKTFMHHLLREKLMLLAATALLRPRAEAHTYEEAKLRADITLWLDGRQHTIDVTVTHAAFDTFAGMTPKTARLMKKIARAYRKSRGKLVELSGRPSRPPSSTQSEAVLPVSRTPQ